MTDIVLKLKDHHAAKDTDAWMDCIEAADEIERLRAALEVTSSDCKEAFADNENLRLALEVAANDLEDWGAYTKAKNARAALEGE